MRRPNQKYPDPEWFAHVRPGDVLQLVKCGRPGAYRIVRAVHHRKDGTIWGVSVAKKARSRYENPTTMFTATELRTMFRYVGARVKLTGELDRRIACTIAERPRCRRVTQDDVVGVVPA